MPSFINTVTANAYYVSPCGKPVLISTTHPACRATCTEPNWDAVRDPKEPLALDIEFQEFRHKDDHNWSHRMGRVALVNTRGTTVYDNYVRYDYDPDVEVKLPPRVFNVTWKDLQLRNGAKEWWVVEENLWKLMPSRLIIGHGMELDIPAVGAAWTNIDKDTPHARLDTQNLYGRINLGKLTSKLFPEQRFEFHDPTEDACATMLLYLRLRPHDGRTSFKDVPFEMDEEDFPALGATCGTKKE